MVGRCYVLTSYPDGEKSGTERGDKDKEEGVG
jgi:hypothetical protein